MVGYECCCKSGIHSQPFFIFQGGFDIPNWLHIPARKTQPTRCPWSGAASADSFLPASSCHLTKVDLVVYFTDDAANWPLDQYIKVHKSLLPASKNHGKPSHQTVFHNHPILLFISLSRPISAPEFFPFLCAARRQPWPGRSFSTRRGYNNRVP